MLTYFQSRTHAHAVRKHTHCERGICAHASLDTNKYTADHESAHAVAQGGFVSLCLVSTGALEGPFLCVTAANVQGQHTLDTHVLFHHGTMIGKLTCEHIVAAEKLGR